MLPLWLGKNYVAWCWWHTGIHCHLSTPACLYRVRVAWCWWYTERREQRRRRRSCIVTSFIAATFTSTLEDCPQATPEMCMERCSSNNAGVLTIIMNYCCWWIGVCGMAWSSLLWRYATPSSALCSIQTWWQISADICQGIVCSCALTPHPLCHSAVNFSSSSPPQNQNKCLIIIRTKNKNKICALNATQNYVCIIISYTPRSMVFITQSPWAVASVPSVARVLLYKGWGFITRRSRCTIYLDDSNGI